MHCQSAETRDFDPTTLPIEEAARAPRTRSPNARRFMGWKDLLVTPLVEAAIFTIAIALTLALETAIAPWHSMSWFERIVTAYVMQIGLSIVALRGIWAIAPAREGIHGSRTMSRYVFNLTGFILTLNLHGICGDLLPCFFRHLVYRALGARVGKGIVVINGKIADPHLTEIGDSAMIGDGALVLAHAIGVVSEAEDYVVLARVSIGAGAIIGARSVLLPGVSVGAHAMVQPLSLVASNTKILPGEIWGGIPAKKVGEIRRSSLGGTSPVAERRSSGSQERAMGGAR